MVDDQEKQAWDKTVVRDYLTSAVDEIEALRKENQILSAKVEVLDLLGEMLHATPPDRGRIMGADNVYLIRTYLKNNINFK